MPQPDNGADPLAVLGAIVMVICILMFILTL